MGRGQDAGWIPSGYMTFRQTIGSWAFAVICCAVWGLALLCLGSVARAESAAISVGWTHVPGLMQDRPGGPPTGFMIELARLVASEAGLDLHLQRFETVPDVLHAQARGEVEMLAGVADLPSIRAASHYSQAVGEVVISVLHRKGDHRLRDLDTAARLRLGGVRGAGGSEVVGPMLRHEFFGFGAVKEALSALVEERIDGLVGPRDALQAIVRANGLGDRVTIAHQPLHTLRRVVALHRSRVELRSRVDAAVARLEADGRLNRLRLDWGIAPPPVAPETLVAGVLHRPPYSMVHDDGSVSGFAVEVVRDIARRAGQEIRFRPLSPAEWRRDPDRGHYDILPFEAIAARRLDSMEFTAPLLSLSYSVFVRDGDPVPPSGRVDLAGKRLGILARDIDVDQPHSHSGAELVVFADTPQMVDALTSGVIDALLADRVGLRHELEPLGGMERMREAGPAMFEVEQAIAVRLDLPEVAKAFDSAISGYLASPRYHELRLARLRLPTAWTSERLAHLLGLLGAFSVLMTGLAVWQHYLRRLRDARRDIAEDLIDKIPLGLVLLSEDRRIKYINRETASTGASRSGLLSVGKNYVSALRDLVDEGRADLDGMDPEDWIASQVEDISIDGRTREVRTVDGVTFLRTTKRLKDGETLLLRQDVTEERERRLQIQLLNEDLQDQIRIANATTEDLRAFAYATSHDLKAPTNTALMIVSALQEDLQDLLPDASSEMFVDLEMTLEGMQTLIEDVRAYTDAIGAQMVALPVDLDAEARAAIEALAGEIRDSGAEVTLTPLPSVNGSPAQIRALLFNLIENGLKFRRPDRPVRIEIGPVDGPEGFVGFAVRDNGIGIDPAHRDRIFKLFQRLHVASEYAGTGIGLALCQRVAFNHGGRVTVDSVPDEGSRFTVLLRKETP